MRGDVEAGETRRVGRLEKGRKEGQMPDAGIRHLASDFLTMNLTI